MNNHLMSGDHAFHDDNQLIAGLAALNDQLGRYVLRYLAADALQADPISVTEEKALAETMITLAGKVKERATSRTPPALEGNPTLRRAAKRRPAER